MKKNTVRVTPEDAEALRKLAAERGQTINETFSEVIRKGLEERGRNGKEKI